MKPRGNPSPARLFFPAACPKPVKALRRSLTNLAFQSLHGRRSGFTDASA
jgi:hypothetical protein